MANPALQQQMMAMHNMNMRYPPFNQGVCFLEYINFMIHSLEAPLDALVLAIIIVIILLAKIDQHIVYKEQ